MIKRRVCHKCNGKGWFSSLSSEDVTSLCQCCCDAAYVYEEKCMSKPIVLSYYVCDECKKPIMDYTDGFHISGNIGFAAPTNAKRLIGSGDWLPKIEKGERLLPTDVPEKVFCKSCFCKLLCIQSTNIRGA